MKIDPYYQRQKCSPGILVSSKYANIRGGSLDRGRQMRVGQRWVKYSIVQVQVQVQVLTYQVQVPVQVLDHQVQVQVQVLMPYNTSLSIGTQT